MAASITWSEAAWIEVFWRSADRSTLARASSAMMPSRCISTPVAMSRQRGKQSHSTPRSLTWLSVLFTGASLLAVDHVGRGMSCGKSLKMVCT